MFTLPDEFPRFRVDAPDIDWGGLYVSATANHYVYYDKLANTRRLKDAGFKVDWLLTKYAEGLVAIRDNQALVVFRGSDNVADWRFNVTALNRKRVLFDQECDVHIGFWESYEPLHEQVLDALEGFDGDLVLTGHSLGGAKALLCALRLQEEGRAKPIVHTVGQPRVGDAAFAGVVEQQLPARYFRVVNQEDVVPLVPTALVHAGHEIFFNAAGVLGERIDLMSAAFAQALDHMPLLKQPMNRETLADLRAYLRQNKDDLWGDIVGRLADPVSKAAVPGIAFHDTGRYARCIYNAWKGQQALEGPGSVNAMIAVN